MLAGMLLPQTQSVGSGNPVSQIPSVVFKVLSLPLGLQKEGGVILLP